MAEHSKSEIERLKLPTVNEQKGAVADKLVQSMSEAMSAEQEPLYVELTEKLVSLGYSHAQIASAALQLHFGSLALPVPVEFDDTITRDNNGKSSKNRRRTQGNRKSQDRGKSNRSAKSSRGKGWVDSKDLKRSQKRKPHRG